MNSLDSKNSKKKKILESHPNSLEFREIFNKQVLEISKLNKTVVIVFIRILRIRRDSNDVKEES